jgi:hypothetical protein
VYNSHTYNNYIYINAHTFRIINLLWPNPVGISSSHNRPTPTTTTPMSKRQPVIFLLQRLSVQGIWRKGLLKKKLIQNFFWTDSLSFIIFFKWWILYYISFFSNSWIFWKFLKISENFFFERFLFLGESYFIADDMRQNCRKVATVTTRKAHIVMWHVIVRGQWLPPFPYYHYSL